MMVRKTIHITEIQAWMLKQRARQERVSESELVRRGLDIVLETGSRSKEARQRALRAVGAFSSGDTDVSERHDEYLAEIYANEHLRE
ncbi:MAG: CopG family transcriptional regulator [Armatimonadetes bacterium]|nr:CopG family transcriptional regulator [Armatimonadota bacterium]